MMTIGSLFAGIGGIELGLEWAGLGPTLYQVEQSAYCRDVLARHWPGAKRYEDVRDVGAATLPAVDLICGGFPCQDVSSAGRRTGLAGPRSGLWVEFARVVAECRPRWVVVENVRSGARKWVDKVRRDLGELGYASLPIPIAAGDLGAPHERARVFIVACAAQHADHEVDPRKSGQARRPARDPATASAAPTEVGRWPCDADRIWASEPDISRMVHGLSGRVERERALGNSVNPQCAEVIGHVIRQLLESAC